MSVLLEAGVERLPRVSVCIPTIDRPHLFKEAIASVAAQTWRDFEIVVGDNSGEIELQRRIDAVISEFPELRFVLVRHPQHIDVADNFNSMIDAATGDFWVCLPDDDRFRPNFLERSIDALDQHPDCAFTFSDHWIIGPDGVIDESRAAANSIRYGRTLLHEGIYPHDRIFDLALRQSFCFQTTMFRRPVIALMRFVPGIFVLDHSLFLRLGADPRPFNGYYLAERMLEYRVHSLQTTSTARRRDFLSAVIAALESVSQVPEKYVTDFNRELSRQYLALAIVEAEQGFHDSARKHAIRSLKLSTNLRSFSGALLTIAAPRGIPLARRLAERVRRIGIGQT